MDVRWQGQRIDFKIEGDTIALYVISPGGASMVDHGGFWFSRTRENVFLDAFSKNFLATSFLSSIKAEGSWPTRHPQLRGPSLDLTETIL